MLRRAGVVLTFAIMLLCLWLGTAQAICITENFEDVLQRSDGVWWATVTNAEVSQGHAPGYWTLKVDIDDSLKGPAEDGGTGIVFYSRCGPGMTEPMLKKAAASLVGETMLFLGKESRSGGLVSSAEFFSPSLQPGEQYEQALADLGLDSPSSPISGLPSAERGTIPVVWFALVAVVLVASALAFWAWRRKTSEG